MLKLASSHALGMATCRFSSRDIASRIGAACFVFRFFDTLFGRGP